MNLCYGTGFKQIKIEYTSQGQPSRVINLTDQKEELNFLYKNGFLRQIQINGRKVAPEFKYVENSLDIKGIWYFGKISKLKQFFLHYSLTVGDLGR